MRFTEEMSIPQWKQLLLQKQQRKREEQERKAREEEEKRLAKLPPWKRHAEQPKTVIFIDKHNVANPVHLSQLSDTSLTNSNSSVANGSAKSLHTESEVKNEIVGKDDTDGEAPSGVSEEHCTTVHDNPFLKLEKKKRKAPPPPKTGASISVVATNVPTTVIGNKATSSIKVASGNSDSNKKNHIPVQQNGPLSINNQSNIKLPEKTSTQESNGKKTKATVANVETGNSISQSKGAQPLATTVIRKTNETISVKSANESQYERRASIVELRTLFGGSGAPKIPAASVACGNKKSQESQQSVHNHVNISSGIPELSESKFVSQMKGNGNHAGAVSVKSSNSLNHGSSIYESVSSVKNDTSCNGKAQTQRKDLQETQKAKASPKKRPSESDMSASAIISLTNDGPLMQCQGQVKHVSSVFADEENISLDSEESPHSPTNRRMKKYGGSSNCIDGSGKHARSPRAVGRSILETKKPDESSGNYSFEKNKDSKNVIAYPKNFRHPNYEPRPKEEMPSPADCQKTSVPASQETASSDNNAKKAAEFLTAVKGGDQANSNYTSTGRSKLSNSDKTSDGIDKSVPEKEKFDADSSHQDIPHPFELDEPVNGQSLSNHPKGKGMPDSTSGNIPYPSDFRKPKPHAPGKNLQGSQKDIVMPSELISSSSSYDDSTKSSGGNDSVGAAPFLKFKLRKTKKPEPSGITVIRSSDNSKKPPVENDSNRSTSTLIDVGSGSSHATGTGKKKVAVKKFEKVNFIGYNSPTNKPSALRCEGKGTKKKVSFGVEEELFEYPSEEVSIHHYDEMHKDQPKDDPTSEEAAQIIKNGCVDSDEEDVGLKNNSAIKSSGGFQNLAASKLSAMDMLLGRGPREETKEPPKPALSQEPEPEPESDDLSLKPEDGDLFSSAGQGTAALLF